MFNFRKITTGNREVMRFQENVDEVFKQLRTATILDGVLVNNVTITTAGVMVSHTLDRQPLGWIVVDRTNANAVHRTAWNSKTLSLTATTGSVTISLWVF